MFLITAAGIFSFFICFLVCLFVVGSWKTEFIVTSGERKNTDRDVKSCRGELEVLILEDMHAMCSQPRFTPLGNILLTPPREAGGGRRRSIARKSEL